MSDVKVVGRRRRPKPRSLGRATRRRHGPGGEPIAIVGALQDIGTLAAHDSVTRLPNHTIFIDHVSRAAVAALARGGWMGVQAIVVDRFATMCATLPQSAIAQVLEQLAERLRSEVHDDGESTLAYFGNGIFAVLYEELADDLDGVLRSRGLADRLTAERVVIAGEELELSVTSGVSVSDGSEDAVRLVASATAAAHRRPSAGSSRVVVADPDVDARAGDWLRRRSELRDAIDRGEIVPFFQPEVDLRTGRAWGVEALVRWQHPERGLLHPGEFLPLAHETGLIVPLGWAVLESACQLAATWRSEGVPRADELRLSVNVDTLQLEDPEFTDRVRETLSKAGLEPSSLVIEITEHGMLEDAMVAAEQLRSLRSLGVAIAMDDFGTGYSSLVQLRRLPVDFLKIDQSFVAGLSEGGEDTAIVRASVRLARSLGLGTVAEGVETAEQLAMLRQLKCDMAQGYHFARPMPADELAAWWEARGRGEPALPPASPPVVRNHC